MMRAYAVKGVFGEHGRLSTHTEKYEYLKDFGLSRIFSDFSITCG